MPARTVAGADAQQAGSLVGTRRALGSSPRRSCCNWPDPAPPRRRWGSTTACGPAAVTVGVPGADGLTDLADDIASVERSPRGLDGVARSTRSGAPTGMCGGRTTTGSTGLGCQGRLAKGPTLRTGEAAHVERATQSLLHAVPPGPCKATAPDQRHHPTCPHGGYRGRLKDSARERMIMTLFGPTRLRPSYSVCTEWHRRWSLGEDLWHLGPGKLPPVMAQIVADAGAHSAPGGGRPPPGRPGRRGGRQRHGRAAPQVPPDRGGARRPAGRGPHSTPLHQSLRIPAAMCCWSAPTAGACMRRPVA